VGACARLRVFYVFDSDDDDDDDDVSTHTGTEARGVCVCVVRGRSVFATECGIRAWGFFLCFTRERSPVRYY